MGNKTNPMDVQTDFDRHKERHQETPTEPIHRASLKWIIIGACILAAAALFVIPIIISANRTGHLELPENINKITIYKAGTSGTTFSYTDSEKLTKLTDFLSSLDLKPASGVNEKEGIILGGGWEIRMDSDGSVSGVKLLGEYVQDPDGIWWVISAGEGHKFEELLRSMIPDEMPDNPIFDEWISSYSIVPEELTDDEKGTATALLDNVHKFTIKNPDGKSINITLYCRFYHNVELIDEDRLVSEGDAGDKDITLYFATEHGSNAIMSVTRTGTSGTSNQRKSYSPDVELHLSDLTSLKETIEIENGKEITLVTMKSSENNPSADPDIPESKYEYMLFVQCMIDVH